MWTFGARALVVATLTAAPSARGADVDTHGWGVVGALSYERGDGGGDTPRDGAVGVRLGVVHAHAGGRLETHATAGWREALTPLLDEHRLPLIEVGESVNVGAFRVGAGVLAILPGELGAEVDDVARPSLGAVLRAELTWSKTGRIALGPLLTWLRVRGESGRTYEGVSGGLSLRIDSNPARRR